VEVEVAESERRGARVLRRLEAQEDARGLCMEENRAKANGGARGEREESEAQSEVHAAGSSATMS